MIERLKKLLTIKSIVTLTLTFCFGYMIFKNQIPKDDFLNLYLIVIAFYFGTQKGREN